MRFTISFIGEAAARAGAAGVARVNRQHGHAVPLGFVFKKSSELVKRPITMLGSLRFSNRYPVSDTRQIFDGQSAACAFSVKNQVFTDAVVYIALVAGLSARQLFKFALGGFCAFALQTLTAIRHFAPLAFNLCAGHYLSVRRGSYVGNPKVHAQGISKAAFRRFFDVADAVQIEVALAVYQINFAFAIGQKLSLIFAAHKRNNEPARHSPKGNSIVGFEADNSIVVSDAAVPFERALSLLVQLVSVRDFRDTAHDHLRGEVKLRLRFVVRQLVQSELFERWLWLGLPALFTNPITRRIRSFKRLAQRLSLLRCWLQFEINYQLHAVIIAHFIKYRQLKRTVESLFAVDTIPLPDKSGSLLVRFL